MNYHKLKDVINMKFMGQSEVRHQLLEYVEKQEPKRAITKEIVDRVGTTEVIFHSCPSCQQSIEYKSEYCKYCGQRVWYD